ncbi:hypothetical protein M433DRAFT_638 [Acidomyces richmondensis BFW]|nr:MAG: hypothetical protein FE78DRAFT_364169 [Acidomyces sp. 'richmondensis']KYG50028.1 hypothetical protein M433DRAFT_638 [Acidomyces richmondensis BFW]
MAEKERGHDVVRELAKVARRPSFRRTLRECQDVLPPAYLEALEEKRKQLDDSIHRFIAAKEREYKQYEKDLRQQAKLAGGSPALAGWQEGHGVSQTHGDGTASGSLFMSRRRTSSESTQDAHGHPPVTAGVLSSSRSRRDANNYAIDEELGDEQAAISGLTDRRSSAERERDLIGVFTPSYLTAIAGRDEHGGERRESAPPKLDSSGNDNPWRSHPSLPRPGSDSAVQAKGKRPAHLQMPSRTSSSGSSADGKLASALKSPTHAVRRTGTKRVSLALGNSIVKPSDSVPEAMSNSTTSSHSRPRLPATDREGMALTGSVSVVESAKPPTSSGRYPDESAVMNGASLTADKNTAVSLSPSPQPHYTLPANTAPPTVLPSSTPIPKSTSKIDPDGDLFDLDVEETDTPPPAEAEAEAEEEIESGEDPTVTGRLAERSEGERTAAGRTPSPRPKAGEASTYDPEAGLLLAPEIAPVTVEEQEGDDTLHIELGPSSADASRQPTSPGYRRPSVVRDPEWEGSDYEAAEEKATTEDIYGSSYVRPASKGSFTAGSLGESYMAQNAAKMMKLRIKQHRDQDVRS